MTANEAQLAAGARWAALRNRWPARTDQDRQDDFDRTEAVIEQERNRRA